MNNFFEAMMFANMLQNQPPVNSCRGNSAQIDMMASLTQMHMLDMVSRPQQPSQPSHIETNNYFGDMGNGFGW